MDYDKYTNKLIEETSPYLQQHAHNPVNWYAWGDEAIERAKKEDKPIFLSVGYSTCYWCHAMEKESFEDEDVAKVLNEHFIAIKVDREERPDIDELYMLATQVLTGRGGWPNSVWLMPDLRPWMAGAYFPKEQLITILNAVSDLWKNRRPEVEQQAKKLTEAVQQIEETVSGAGGTTGEPKLIDQRLIDKAIAEYEQSFDEDFGGFGGAPKFPPHGVLRVLIYEYGRTHNADLLRMITRTLDSIRLGGIHDHIGGGFHRYSTDREWLVPHFEKMLYDNAQLIRNYTDAYLLTNAIHYRQEVEDIFNWLQNEMISPEGGFYTALDAGEFDKEGEAYLWRYDEIVEALGEKDALVFAEVYNLSQYGNFTEERTGRKTGTNIIYLKEPIEDIVKSKGGNPERFVARIADLRVKLLARRSRRKQPYKDDKMVAGLNGLMIGALAYAGRKLNEPQYTHTAANAADFILNNLVGPASPAGFAEAGEQNRLLRTYRQGRAKVPAFLDDYAYLAEGLLELFEATGEVRWAQEARRLADIMLNEFEDKENGGFFFAGASTNNLLIRSKNLSEGGNVPVACGIAAVVFLELGRLAGQIKYEQSAKRTLESLYGILLQSPISLNSGIYAAAMCLRQTSA